MPRITPEEAQAKKLEKKQAISLMLESRKAVGLKDEIEKLKYKLSKDTERMSFITQEIRRIDDGLLLAKDKAQYKKETTKRRSKLNSELTALKKQVTIDIERTQTEKFHAVLSNAIASAYPELQKAFALIDKEAPSVPKLIQDYAKKHAKL